MKGRRKAGPVSTTWLQTVRCTICQRTFAYQPGQAGAVLTRHYGDAHPQLIRTARHVAQ